MFLQIVAALLLAAGVLLYLWCLTGWLLMPFGGKELQLVLRVCGDAAHLERQLRALSWLRGSGLLQGRLVILDCGLNEQGLALVHSIRRKYDVILKYE